MLVINRGTSLASYGFDEIAEGLWIRRVPNDKFPSDEIALLVSNHLGPDNRLVLNVCVEKAELFDANADLDILYKMIQDGVVSKC